MKIHKLTDLLNKLKKDPEKYPKDWDYYVRELIKKERVKR